MRLSTVRLHCLILPILLVARDCMGVPFLSNSDDVHSEVSAPAVKFTKWYELQPNQRQSTRQVGFESFGPLSRSVLMVNGTAEDILFCSFVVEPGKTLEDYDVAFTSSKPDVLNADRDISVSNSVSGLFTNMTVTVDFDEFPGKVTITMKAVDKANGVLFDSLTFDYIVAGMAVYVLDTRAIVSGLGRSFVISNFKKVYEQQHWELGVFAQYLNGSDSSEVLKDSRDESVFRLSDMGVDIFGNTGQVLWDQSACLISDGDWSGSELTLKTGCGAGFAAGQGDTASYDGIHFAFDLEKNRAGDVLFLFTWKGFTRDSIFDDEDFTTYIDLRIGGQPPVVVRRIDPANPFSRNGGEQLYLEMINSATATIVSFNVGNREFLMVDGSRRIISGPDEFYETAVFLTEPGTGKQLPWTISATRKIRSASGVYREEIAEVIDETGFLFSYDDEGLMLTSIEPEIFPEAGAAGILFGNFTSFNVSDPSHVVLVGNQQLRNRDMKFASAESLSVSIPPRNEIGNAWDYEVVVQTGNSVSNALSMEYMPSTINLQTQIFGASSEPGTDVFKISRCGETTFFVALEGQDGTRAEYLWALYNSRQEDLLSFENASALVTNESVLILPNQFIAVFDVLFTILVQVSFGGKKQQTEFLVRRTKDIVLGVTLIQPENRTISSPQVNMRVIAKADVPECYEGPVELEYIWDYEDKTKTLPATGRAGSFPLSVHDLEHAPEFDSYLFSFTNETGTSDGTITPARLGREFIVPRERLGHGEHRIRLTVKGVNDSGLIGESQTSVFVNKSPLRAIIGTGQKSRRASDSEDLYMSAQGSTDPDAISLKNPRQGLSFSWNCTFSLRKDMGDSAACQDMLLPPKDRNSSLFVVRASALQQYTKLSSQDDDREVYVQYDLSVSKEGRQSHASQKLAVVGSMGQRLVSYDRIEVVNSQGATVDTDYVDFWEDVIIRPIASANTNWRFRLEEPIAERAFFFSSDAKLITGSGYYRSGGRSEPGFQTVPLGIAADKLAPHQTYVFSVTLQEPNRITEKVMVHLKTIELPKLFFPQMPRYSGTTNTTFRATATTSFEGNSTFSFQFYLVDLAAERKEYCVDGCTGANFVRFQIAKPGNYILQCRLLSSNGKKLLAVKNNTAVVTIGASGNAKPARQFDLDMDRLYKLGDDGAVNQRGFFATRSILAEDGQVVARSDRSADEQCSEYATKWVKMSRSIVGNDLPNTANARNYISIASNYAELKCVEDDETLYELLAIVDQSIKRTPREEILSTLSYSARENLPNVELQENLVTFYNHTMTRSISTIASGTSRNRLKSVAGEINNLLLDLSEMWMKHITTSATSGRVCGWDATYTSNALGGDPESALGSKAVQDAFGVNTIRVAVMCNKEQGMSLSTPHAKFEWCDAVYGTSLSERKLITLAESYDYPYFSGIQGQNRSDSRRLVMVDITTLGESNQLVSAMSDGAVLAQAEDEAQDAGSCYKVSLSMSPQVMARSAGECSTNVPYHMWPRKQYGQQLTRQFEGDSYQRRTQGISVTPETRNGTQEVVAQSNILGLYGAYRESCYPPALSLRGEKFSVLFIICGVLLTVLVLSVLTYKLMTVMVVDEPEDNMLGAVTYVERDFFGRGQVRLNMYGDDEDFESVSDEESEQQWTGPGNTGRPFGMVSGDMTRRQVSDELLDGLDPNLRNHSAILAATQTHLPTGPPLT